MKLAILTLTLLALSPTVKAMDINIYVSFKTYCWEDRSGQAKGCTRELDQCLVFVGTTPKDMTDKIKVTECPDRTVQNMCTDRTGFGDVFYYETSGDVHRGAEHEQCLATGGRWWDLKP